ncbi:MAG: glycosyltransferase family 4 protein [Nitrososphaerota archaeon]|nr:glycosyltransferase family 4 protein [Nitrososphaerota archaeon]
MAKIGIYVPSNLEYYGGGERIAIDLANFLKREGHDVSIIGDRASSGTNRVEKEFVDSILSVNYELVDYVNNSSFLPKTVVQRRPPIAILGSFDLNLVFVQRLPERKYVNRLNELGIKVVFLLHGITFEHLSLHSGQFFVYNVLMRLILLRNARTYARDGICFQVLNELTASALADSGIPRDRIYLIKNGISMNPAASTSNMKTFKVLWIGRIEDRQKGIKRLIKVCEKLENTKNVDNIELMVAGNGSDAALVQKASQRLKILNYLSYVSEGEKASLLKEAHLFVLTSNSEPFSIAILEALSNGIPFVSTPVSGALSVVQLDQSFGLISTFKPTDIAASILKFHQRWNSDSNQYLFERQQRMDKAKSMLTFQKTMESYRSLVEHCLFQFPSLHDKTY